MHKLLINILNYAIAKGSSDIHFVMKEKCLISLRIHNEMVVYRNLPYQQGLRLLNYIRYFSRIDTNFKLKPQTGAFSLDFNDCNYSFRTSSLPANKKDSIVIRILNNHSRIDLNSISKDYRINEFLTSIAAKRNGLFLICGPTGSGKSTSLYALLDYLDANFHRNIITIEDPIEMPKDYCLQIQLNESMGISYQTTLKQILRHDPDVIMIGEIRDSMTAKLVVEASLTGHLVLSTLHSSNCLQALSRLMNLGITRYDLSEIIKGICCQRIVFDEHKDLLLLSEFIDGKNLNSYFLNRDYEIYSFSRNIEKLNESGHISAKFKEQLENEL